MASSGDGHPCWTPRHRPSPSTQALRPVGAQPAGGSPAPQTATRLAACSRPAQQPPPVGGPGGAASSQGRGRATGLSTSHLSMSLSPPSTHGHQAGPGLGEELLWPSLKAVCRRSPRRPVCKSAGRGPQEQGCCPPTHPPTHPPPTIGHPPTPQDAWGAAPGVSRTTQAPPSPSAGSSSRERTGEGPTRPYSRAASSKPPRAEQGPGGV